MQLTVRHQILITAVRRDVLRPGETIEVSDAVGAGLLASHPYHFAAKAAEPVANKMAAAPKNKSSQPKGT